MSEIQSFERPEDRIILTVDFNGYFMKLFHLASDFNSQIHAVKLGQGFLLHEKAHAIQKHLLKLGTTIYFDAKYREDPDQMNYVVNKSAELEYSYVSVAPTAGSLALQAAGMAQPKVTIVSSLSSGDKEINAIELRNIQDANRDLDPENQLNFIMCNVADIGQVKDLGDFTVIATGIRMPGDEAHDQPTVATPSEALQAGADYLAVGRAITASSVRPAEAFQRILEDIGTIQ